VGGYIKKYAAGKITVRGYTDSVGKAAANQALSEKRAQKVKEYLAVEQNIPAADITTEGLGSSQPVAGNETEAGRALNRRVEISIPTGQ
jgi:OOP family OmpA-OmpF porin